MNGWLEDMMKQPLIYAVVSVGILIAGFAIFKGQQPLQGKHSIDGGTIYYFADGFVAQDTRRTSHEFYLVEIHPKHIQHIDLDGDGLSIHLKASAPKELVTNIVSSTRPEAGRVATFRKQSDAYVWNRNVVMEMQTIQTFVTRQNREDSISMLLDH